MIHLIGELHVEPERLVFEINREDMTESISKLDNHEVILEIKKKTKKRSLNANNFCWKLCSLIAAELETDKDSIYRDMLRRYGQFVDIECMKPAAPKIQSLFRASEIMNDGFEKSDKITVRGYIGSHSYDTHEMSILINGIVSECREMGIDTWSQEEIDNLVASWQPVS